MENLHEPIIWAIVVIILAFQLISFFNTKSDIKKLQNFFPSNFDIDKSTDNLTDLESPENGAVIDEDLHSSVLAPQVELISEPTTQINSEPDALWVGVIHPVTGTSKRIEATKAGWYIQRGWEKA